MSVQAKVQRPVSSCLSPLQGLVAGQPHVRGAALQALDHSPAVNDGTGEGGMGSWVGGVGQLGGSVCVAAGAAAVFCGPFNSSCSMLLSGTVLPGTLLCVPASGLPC